MGKRIDLGCGGNKVDGCIGVDIWRENEPDIVADVRTVVPGLEDGSAEYVVCRHVLEHLDYEEWRAVMREISRLLEPGGKFEIRVPHPACDNAMIHGHNFVFTPHWWRQLRNGAIDIKLPLTIDAVDEIPDPLCVEFCASKGLVFADWSGFLRNAFYETAIYGHRC